MAVVFLILIRSGIPDAQAKMSVSKKASHAIKIGKFDTAANSRSAFFPHVHPLYRISAGCNMGQKG